MSLAWAGWPGVARRLLTFFGYRPKKVSKKRRPLLSATLRFATGTLRYSLQAESAQTRLRLKQARALIRLALRSSAPTEGVGEWNTNTSSRTAEQPKSNRHRAQSIKNATN